jgi:two-component sensor histidine kinase
MLDTFQKNYEAAVYDLLQFNKINDSLFNETKIRHIKQMEVEYETEKKENEIKIKDQSIRILNQKSELQLNRLQQANLIKDITIVSVLLLSTIIGLLYRQYRQKKKSNEVITQKNELLQHLLTEKEWLLKEVHHRVKNNLHTVICLLESQARYLENDALKAIESSQHRIYAMSLIHQKLYQSDDVKAIDMALYLPEFVRYLNDSFGTQRQIRFKMDIEPLLLGVSQAIPIALIVNEAVTNSIKYAFPKSKSGIIEIRMHKVQQEIILFIADNGIGINPVIANTPPESLGLKLMKGLSEDIHASINIKNDQGTKIIIVFNIDPLNDANNLITKTQERKIFS